MLIVAGGVIPPQDYDAVLQAGAAEIFPPGTVIPEAADRLMDRLLRRAESVIISVATAQI